MNVLCVWAQEFSIALLARKKYSCTLRNANSAIKHLKHAVCIYEPLPSIAGRANTKFNVLRVGSATHLFAMFLIVSSNVLKLYYLLIILKFDLLNLYGYDDVKNLYLREKRFYEHTRDRLI